MRQSYYCHSYILPWYDVIHIPAKGIRVIWSRCGTTVVSCDKHGGPYRVKEGGMRALASAAGDVVHQ
jgi:hypothetical protein